MLFRSKIIKEIEEKEEIKTKIENDNKIDIMESKEASNVLGTTPRDTNKEMLASENANEISGILDMSRSENYPLVSTSIINPSKNRDEFLQKAHYNYNDQDQVVKNILKGNNTLGNNENEGKNENKVENPQNPTPGGVSAMQGADKDLNDEIGSVASRTKSLMKHIKALRNAVYEQYCPRSVKQLNYVGRLVFTILVIIALIYYFVTRSLYSNLNSNVSNVDYTKSRLIYITSMGSCIRTLMLMNPEIDGGDPIITKESRPEKDYNLDGFEGEDIEDYNEMSYES